MLNMIATIAYRKGLKKQKEVLRELKEMFNASSIFEIDSTTNVLMVWFITVEQYKPVYEILVLFCITVCVKLSYQRQF